MKGRNICVTFQKCQKHNFLKGKLGCFGAAIQKTGLKAACEAPMMQKRTQGKLITEE